MYTAIFYIIIFQYFPLFKCSRDFAEFRIVGGTPVTDNGEFLYEVSIHKNNKHSCGGSIIAPTKILTAGHCLRHKKKEIFKIYAGITNLSGTKKKTTQKLTIKTYTVHPDFNGTTLTNDIAIITLDSPIKFDEITNLITLRAERVETGEKLTVSGWGYTSKHSKVSQSLQWLNVSVLRTSKCKHSMRDSKFKLKHSNICSTPIFGEGTCKGDSGGPLVDQNYQLVGIVSWGKPCAKGVPDVFTSISHHYKWIMNELK